MMRSRREIEKRIEDLRGSPITIQAARDELLLEILLDIRDLLEEINIKC